MKSTINASAILAGEQRSVRFMYHHSVAGAANETGFPASWIWFWLLVGRLKYQIWLRKVWVRLEAVLELFGDQLALRDAFYATGEFLASVEAIRRVAERWPDEPHPYVRFQGPAKRPAQAATPNPVCREEQESEVAA